MNISITKPCAISEKSSPTNREEQIFPSPEAVKAGQRLFLLCEGDDDNGHATGSLACESFLTFFTAMLDAETPSPDFIRKAIQYTEANLEMYRKERPNDTAVPLSLAMLYISSEGITVAHTGNCRIYHFRHGHIIYRTASKTNASVRLIRDLQPDDHFFLCTSDNSMGSITDDKLSSIFRQKLPPEIIKDELVEYCDSKNRKNYSFYIIPVLDVQETISYKQSFLSFLSSIA
ncbi:MAG: hypothetical protein LBH04_01370 [Tannerellaceae bacterium]|jgi:protein phosphatase|nr:hypothetical protein [Tannerellaceae bacterium]